MQVTSTFWAATQPLPRAERATIPHMKEEMEGFHMNPISKIFFGEKALFSAQSQSKGAASYCIVVVVMSLTLTCTSSVVFCHGLHKVKKYTLLKSNACHINFNYLVALFCLVYR